MTKIAKGKVLEVWQERVKSGETLFRQGALERARVEFEAAICLQETTELVYTLGEVCLAMHDVESATHYFRRYLVLSAKKVQSEKSAA
tara:strand:+ start:674 stop:937 length:264 start_codon:yes stop_codon:yes gene_type:complete